MSHRVLFALRNPFVKTYPHQGSKPCFVWLTRDRIHDGFGPSPGTEYLLILYGFKGNVKHILRWHVLNRA